jgi:hypothetical protein
MDAEAQVVAVNMEVKGADVTGECLCSVQMCTPTSVEKMKTKILSQCNFLSILY